MILEMPFAGMSPKSSKLRASERRPQQPVVVDDSQVMVRFSACSSHTCYAGFSCL